MKTRICDNCHKILTGDYKLICVRNHHNLLSWKIELCPYCFKAQLDYMRKTANRRPKNPKPERPLASPHTETRRLYDVGLGDDPIRMIETNPNTIGLTTSER